MENPYIGNNVLSLSPSNINEMFYIFHNENDSSRLLDKVFLLSCTSDNLHKRHHKLEYVPYKISFRLPLGHPKICKRK